MAMSAGGMSLLRLVNDRGSIPSLLHILHTVYPTTISPHHTLTLILASLPAAFAGTRDPNAIIGADVVSDEVCCRGMLGMERGLE
jgi:hypothetical protein